jgi:hypothetical protein
MHPDNLLATVHIKTIHPSRGGQHTAIRITAIAAKINHFEGLCAYYLVCKLAEKLVYCPTSSGERPFRAGGVLFINGIFFGGISYEWDESSQFS